MDICKQTENPTDPKSLIKFSYKDNHMSALPLIPYLSYGMLHCPRLQASYLTTSRSLWRYRSRRVQFFHLFQISPWLRAYEVLSLVQRRAPWHVISPGRDVSQSLPDREQPYSQALLEESIFSTNAVSVLLMGIFRFGSCSFHSVLLSHCSLLPEQSQKQSDPSSLHWPHPKGFLSSM